MSIRNTRYRFKPDANQRIRRGISKINRRCSVGKLEQLEDRIVLDAASLDFHLDIGETQETTEVNEDGTTDTFTVALSAAPTADVHVTIDNSDPGEVSLDTTQLTFSTGNWNVAQVVTVTGVDDSIFDPFEETVIRFDIDEVATETVLRIQTQNNDLLDIQPGDEFVASIDTNASIIGNNLLNLPDALGTIDPPRNKIGGWINFSFSELAPGYGGFLQQQGVQNLDRVLEFSVDLELGGLQPGALNSSTGAQYITDRIHAFADAASPLGNRGVIDTVTGEVGFFQMEYTIQRTASARINKTNRAAYGVRRTFPLVLGDDPASQAARQLLNTFEPTISVIDSPAKMEELADRRIRDDIGTDEINMFAIAQFDADENGQLTNFEFHGETVFTTALFPFLPVGQPPRGFPSPVTLGPNGEFYFSNPDNFWREPDQVLLDAISPNGIEITVQPPGMLFQPWIHMVTKPIAKRDPNLTKNPASAPVALAGASSAEIGGSIYTVGGILENGETSQDLRRYDPLANVWTQLASPSVERSSSHGGLIAAQEKLYWVGGDSGAQTLNHLSAYDPTTDTWTELTPLPTSIHSAAYGHYDGELFIAGGFNDSGEVTDQVQIYDIATDSWRLGSPMLTQHSSAAGAGLTNGRAAMGSVTVGSDLHMFGGTVDSSGVASRESWVYNMLTDFWTETTSLQEAVVYPAAGYADGTLMAMGGRTEIGGRTTSFDQYRDLRQIGTWSKRNDTGRLPFAESAAAMFDGTVYLTGGFIDVGKEALDSGPGQIIAATRTASLRDRWTISDDQPLIHSLSLMNAASTRPDIGVNSRAVILGHGLLGVPVEQISVTIDGTPLTHVSHLRQTDPDSGALEQDRLYVDIPESLVVDPNRDYMELAVTVAGKTSTAKVDIIKDNVPELFTYNFFEVKERSFIDDAGAFSTDTNGFLNFPRQPARHGEPVVMYVTGLASDTTPADLTATIEGRSANVLAVGNDPNGQSTIKTVTLEVPLETSSVNHVFVTITADGHTSRRGSISVYPDTIVPDPPADELVPADVGREWMVTMANAPEAPPVSEPGIVIEETDGITLVSELGTTDTFTVTLAAAPTNSVTLNLTSVNENEIVIDGAATLEFTPQNWAVPQVVSVRGVDDSVFDGTQFVPLSISVVNPSSDVAYHDLGAIVISQVANDELLNVSVGDVFNATLDAQESDFGDEFVNFPEDILGAGPAKPGNTHLLGRVEVAFQDVSAEMNGFLQSQGVPVSPFADLIQFELDYFGYGAPESIEFGSGAQYHLTRNRIYSNQFTTDPTANRGVMDLHSGDVFYVNVSAILNNTTANQVDNANRIQFGFVNTYPPNPLPGPFAQQLALLDPPIDVLRNPFDVLEYLEQVRTGTVSGEDKKIFSFAKFHASPDGELTNFEFHGESLAPLFFLNAFPKAEPPIGSPTPFSLGPNGKFFFARPNSFWKEPDQALVDYLDQNPNSGIELPLDFPNAAYLHPHANFVSEELQRVDPNTNLVSAPRSLPKPLGGLAVEAIGEKLYAFGGNDTYGFGNQEVYRFDQVTNLWTTLSVSGTTPRTSYAASGVQGDMIYSVGGSQSGKATAQVFEFNTTANQWSQLADMPIGVHSAAHGIHDGKLYVVGGITADGSLSADTQIYDIKNNSWTFGTPLPGRAGRAAAASVVNGSTLYVLGGTTTEDSFEANNEVLIFNMSSQTWISDLPRLVTPVVYAAAGLTDNQIALYGGRSSIGGPATSTHQALDFRNQGWQIAGRTRGTATDVGSATIADRLYLVGGFDEQGAEAGIFGPRPCGLHGSREITSDRLVDFDRPARDRIDESTECG